jgi:magnesium transporter
MPEVPVLIDSNEKNINIELIEYSEQFYSSVHADSITQIQSSMHEQTIKWINVEDITDNDTISAIGEMFSIHPLTLEDISNTDQRSKLEEYDNYIYMVLKMLSFDEQTSTPCIEQVSIILGKDFVITFQEGKKGDVFENIRQKISSGKSKARKLQTDYLAYLIIDAIVDNYFNILEKIEDNIEFLQELLTDNATGETLKIIDRSRRDMLYLRKAVWPLREVMSLLTHADNDLIKKSTILYFRDVYDHTVQVIDSIETYRDIFSGMIDVYLSNVSNRMNQIMKVLTMISTIFMPLSFLTGFYGMNFKYLPGLDSRLSVVLIASIMLLIGFGMFFYFKKKKWF